MAVFLIFVHLRNIAHAFEKRFVLWVRVLGVAVSMVVSVQREEYGGCVSKRKFRYVDGTVDIKLTLVLEEEPAARKAY